MALELGRLELFGLDLSRLWESFVAGWQDALRWPAFAWLTTEPAVLLHRADGSTEWRRGASSQPAAAGREGLQAIELPEEIVLYRELILPDLLPADLRRAAELEVELNSPFPLSELAWGMTQELLDDGRRRVRIAFAARKHVAACLFARGLEQDSCEVWADSDAPVVLPAYGEEKRLRIVRQHRRKIFVALAAVVGLLLVLAATPWYNGRAQVFDAQERHARLEAEVAPILLQREALLNSSTQLEAIREVFAGEADALAVLARLTALLPDDAYLTRLEVNGPQVRFAGIAANAARLVELLGREQGLSEVRTPTAISRTADGRESFTIEFQYRQEGQE